MEELSGWHKSSYSAHSDNCVEVGYGEGVIGVRDTKDRSAGTLVFTRAEWKAFLDGVKAGEFDDLR